MSNLPEQVQSLEDLAMLARSKKSVYTPGSPGGMPKPLPAAFVINMTGHRIAQLFRVGLYVYEPQSRQKNPFPAKRLSSQQPQSDGGDSDEATDLPF